VVDVRRSSDDAEESFTAAEVADGTLEDWVNENVVKYSSDFSSSLDGFSVDSGDTALAGQTFEGESDVIKHTPSGSLSSSHRIRRLNIIPSSSIVSLKVLVYIPSSNTVANGAEIRNVAAEVVAGTSTTDEWVEVEATGTSGSGGSSATLAIHATSGGSRNFTGNGTDAIYYKNVSVTVTAADGTVSKWYDQSGNANHATQGTPASQPKIVSGGSLVSGGLDFDGFNDGLSVSGQVLTSSSFYAASVMNHATGTSTGGGQNVFGQYQIGTSGRFQLSANASNEYSFFANATDPIVGFSTGAIGTAQTLISVNGDGSNAEIWRDGTSKATDTYSGFTPANVNFTIGIDATGDREFNGNIAEVIIYASDQSANRTAFEANIGETYGIDLPSGVDTGYDQVDGFVETWYDQSGNGNDATQSVAGNQPKIVSGGVFLGQVDFLNGVSTFLETNNHNLANLPELSLFSVLEPVTASANEFAISAGSIVNSTGNYGGWALWVNGYFDRLDFTTQAKGSGTRTQARGNITSTSPVVYSATLNGTNAQAAVNGVLGTENTSMITPYNGNATRRKLRLGCQYTFTPASFYRGAMKEVIFYPSDQSANREGIEANINNQYDIY